MAAWGPKDPDATRDYGIDWAKDIGDATIATSTWLLNGEDWPVDADLVKVSDAKTATTTTIRVRAGIDDQDYRLTNHVVLSNGEADDWTEKLMVRER
jgi:hypothetical protein